MFKKDSVLFGIALGTFFPIVSYALFLYLDEAIEAAEIQTRGGVFQGFDNLYAPLAIVANLIPFHYFNRKRMDNAMRGVIFPTILLVIAWGFYFEKLKF